jgi:hypothetical protein
LWTGIQMKKQMEKHISFDAIFTTPSAANHFPETLPLPSPSPTTCPATPRPPIMATHAGILRLARNDTAAATARKAEHLDLGAAAAAAKAADPTSSQAVLSRVLSLGRRRLVALCVCLALDLGTSKSVTVLSTAIMFMQVLWAPFLKCGAPGRGEVAWSAPRVHTAPCPNGAIFFLFCQLAFEKSYNQMRLQGPHTIAARPAPSPAPHPVPLCPSCLPCSQMLAYPISSASGMPWAGQDVVVPVARFLGVVSALDTGAVGFPVFVVACAWICGLFAVGCIVAGGYYRERHSNTLPVKVRVR